MHKEKIDKSLLFWFFSIGGIALIIGILISYNHLKFLQTAKTAQGVTIGVDPLKIEFVTQKGVKTIYHTGKSSYTRSGSIFSLGTTYTLLYNPENPNDAAIDDFWGFWKFAFICFLVTFLSFSFPIIYLYRRSKFVPRKASRTVTIS